jgi:hypothetical protein
VAARIEERFGRRHAVSPEHALAEIPAEEGGHLRRDERELRGGVGAFRPPHVVDERELDRRLARHLQPGRGGVAARRRERDQRGDRERSGEAERREAPVLVQHAQVGAELIGASRLPRRRRARACTTRGACAPVVPRAPTGATTSGWPSWDI